jgi:hypothetical protein
LNGEEEGNELFLCHPYFLQHIAMVDMVSEPASPGNAEGL